MRAIHFVGVALPLLALPLVAIGCAWPGKPTPALNTARQTYAEAAQGPAPQYAPEQLVIARDSLARAQRATRMEDTDAVSFARLAQSRAQLAGRTAEAAIAMNERDQATGTLAQLQRMREAQLAQAAAQQEREGRALMQAILPLARLADDRQITGGQTQLVFTHDLNFGQGGATLSPAAKEKLDRVAEALQSAPTSVIVIEGFSDSTGKPEGRQAVSQRRADAVADYLASRGVPRGQIQTEGQGDTQPLASNDTPEGRAANRRVAILIQLAPPPAGVTNMQPCGPGQQQ